MSRLSRSLGLFAGTWGTAEAIGRPVAAAIPFASANRLASETESVVLLACESCDDVKVNGAWVFEEDAVRALRTFERESPPAFAFTVCDDCAHRIGSRRNGRGARRFRSSAR